MSTITLNPKPVPLTAPRLHPGLALVKGGTFVCGDQSGKGFGQERPCFTVTLSDYLITRTTITVAEFYEFVIDMGPDFRDSWMFCLNPCFIIKHVDEFRIAPGAEKFPMTNISFEGAVAFCNWLSAKHGLEPVYELETLESDFSRSGYRLPTEAEWEWACKGDGEFLFGFSNTFEGDKINSKEYNGNRRDKLAGTHKIGGFGLYTYSPIETGALPANANGMHEMLGNVHEWCHDKYLDYTEEAKVNPNSNDRMNCSFRVIRGGAFNSELKLLRSTYRHAFHYKAKCYSLGFRIAKNTLS